ncbi:MAG: hypothetical protein ACRC8M_09175, partial [Cetobacterium sp.]|uniref:hypothetical protein n=1 Tax=Cetobacterium sp. TaxID=2071632 RepID=UPI003F3DF7E5
RSCCLLLMRALLRFAFSCTISAKKSLILSQREQNEGKALATPKSGPTKREYLKRGMLEGGLGGKSGGGGPSPHIFYERKKPATDIPILHWRYVPHRWLVPAEYRPTQKAEFLE